MAPANINIRKNSNKSLKNLKVKVYIKTQKGRKIENKRKQKKAKREPWKIIRKKWCLVIINRKTHKKKFDKLIENKKV